MHVPAAFHSAFESEVVVLAVSVKSITEHPLQLVVPQLA
jgi:hypothetical protein